MNIECQAKNTQVDFMFITAENTGVRNMLYLRLYMKEPLKRLHSP